MNAKLTSLYGDTRKLEDIVVTTTCELEFFYFDEIEVATLNEDLDDEFKHKKWLGWHC